MNQTLRRHRGSKEEDHEREARERELRTREEKGWG